MIEHFVGFIEESINNFARTAYNALAADLASGLWLVAALIFVAMMINAVTQIKDIGLMAYVGWFMRMAIIISMASSWTYFQPIYSGVQSLPDSIAGALTGTANVWQSLDEIAAQCFAEAEKAIQNAAMGLSLTGAILWVVGAIIVAFGTGLALIAKGGMAVALGLAPVFISTLLSSSTSNIFASWAKTVIGLVMLIVVLTGVVALIQALFVAEVSRISNTGGMADTGRFLAVCIVSIVMLTQIPGLASGVSGAIVSGASGLAVTSKVAGFAKDALSSTSRAPGQINASAKTGAAMAAAARSGAGLRDSAARAMQARRDIAKSSRSQSPDARRSAAADQYRASIKASRLD
ncbi:type IV secretion system protein [uncultured Ruegeria sp.]|uniref:type IV secretion system protein n=1 Tax=uncultured Ruegeria sp. TaxID=259304 RepID=UPI00261C1B00|nr:type IV secretion system protein [uncultured Ruegeria sp.]